MRDLGARHQRCRHHIRAHVPAACHQQVRGILAGQPLGAQRGSGASAQPGDGACVQQGQRGAGSVVADQRGAKDLGQALRGILREPGGQLEAKQARARKLSRANVHVRHTRLEGRVDHGPRHALTLCLLAVGVLDGVERVGHRKDLLDICCRKNRDGCHGALLLSKCVASDLTLPATAIRSQSQLWKPPTIRGFRVV